MPSPWFTIHRFDSSNWLSSVIDCPPIAIRPVWPVPPVGPVAPVYPEPPVNPPPDTHKHLPQCVESNLTTILFSSI